MSHRANPVPGAVPWNSLVTSQPGLQGHWPPVTAPVTAHSFLASPSANQHRVPLSSPQRGHRGTFWAHRTPLSTLGKVIIHLLIPQTNKLQGSFPPGILWVCITWGGGGEWAGGY